MARVFAGVGLRNIKPLPGGVISLVSGWLLALIICLIFQFQALVSLSLADIGWLAIIGLLSFALGRGFNFLGIKHIGVSRSTTIYASYPIYSMVLAIIFLKEKVSVALVIGVLLIIGGLILLVSERETQQMVVKGANKLLGIGFSMASAISYGANTVLIKWVVSNRVNPVVTVTIALLFGTLMLSPFSGRHLITSMKSNHRATGFMVLSGFAMTVGAMSSYSALKLIPAVVASPLGATSPLFAILVMYIFLKRMETVTSHVVIGSLLVVGGGILVTMG